MVKVDQENHKGLRLILFIDKNLLFEATSHILSLGIVHRIANLDTINQDTVHTIYPADTAVCFTAKKNISILTAIFIAHSVMTITLLMPLSV